MPPKRAGARARGPRLSAVPESPPASRQDVRVKQEDDPAEEMPIDMEPMDMSGFDNSDDDDDFANDEEEGLINYEHDDYGAILPVEVDSEELEIIENPAIPPDWIAPDETDFPERQRGISLRVRQKYSRIRTNMNKTEKATVGVYKEIKKMICDSFRSVFQARDNVNQVLLAASHNLVKCYKKSLNNGGRELNAKNVFFQQLDLRLNSIVDETSLAENRGRVFKLCATLALELTVLGFDEQVLIFFLDFIDQWENDADQCRRANAVIFACFIFETGLSRKRMTAEELRNPRMDQFCDLELDTALRNFMTLKRGLLDKDTKVRCPAIRGMAVIQKVPLPSAWPHDALESSPRELIVRSIHDKSWECRLTAIRSLSADERDVQLICNVIAYDKSTVVRVAALEKLGEFKPSWEPQLITPLMVTAFRDHEVQVRDAAKGTLRAWITLIAKKYRKRKNKVVNTDRDIIVTKETGEEEVPDETKGKGYILGAQALVLVFYINTPMSKEHQANLRRVVVHMLEVLRTMYHCQQDMVGTFVEQISEDIKIVKNTAALPLIMKSTISTLLEDCDVVQGQDLNTTRAMVFFWRCFVEFCVDHAHNPADRTVSISRFLCPLKTMVEHFDVFLVRVKHEEQAVQLIDTQIRHVEASVYVMQMSLVENYLCAMKHAEAEATGKEAYRQMLISMMMNPFYLKKVFDLIFQELAQYFHDCPEDLLSLFKAKITEMRMKWRGDEFPEIEDAVLVGSKKFEDEWEEERRVNRRVTKLEQGKRFIDQYEVKILNCILKTGLLPEWGSEYEARYGKMLRHQIATTDQLSNKVNAIECLGMIGTYDFDLVKDDFAGFIRDWDHLGSEDIQATVVSCLTDMYLMNPEIVDDINQIIADEFGKVDEFRLFLGDILVNESATTDSELLLRSVEAFCRILVNSRFSPDDENAQRSIVSLMHRASLKLTDTYDAKLRSTILTTLSLFSGMSQRNQLLIVYTFPLFFQSFLRNQHIVGLVNDKEEDVLTKLKRVGACFVTLTRHSSLPIAEQARTTPAQLLLVRAILDEVSTHATSDIVEFYLSALPHIEFEAFDPMEQRKLFGDLDTTIQLHDDTDAQDRARISELRKAKKKLARLIGINEDDEVPPSAAEGGTSTVPASRAESRISTKPGRGRRGGPAAATPAFSVSSRAASVATTVTGREEEESGIDEMADDYEPPEDRRATARRKAAAAKSVQDMMASPEARAARKPPSRPATATRSTRAPSARSAAATPLRTSARRLNQD